MKRATKNGWRAMVIELGEAVTALLRAERSAVQNDLRRSSAALLGVVACFALAAVLGVFFLATAVAALVAVLALWLPVWGAAACVAGALLLAVAVAAAIGWWRWQRWDSFAGVVERRLRDASSWWRDRLLAEEGGDGAIGEGGDDDGRGAGAEPAEG